MVKLPPPLLSALRLALAILALIAVGRQLQLHLAAGYPATNFFSYFTNLSNLFAAGVLVISAFHLLPRHAPGLRHAAAVNMAVVGIVFAILLRDVDLGALLPWVNFMVHTVMPVAVVLDFVLDRSASQGTTRQVFLVLIFPACYLVYTLLRGAGTGWYPYPFLNPANAGGYAGVALYAAGICVTYVLVALLLHALSRRA